MILVTIGLFSLMAVSALASGEKLSMSLQLSGFHRNLRYVTFFLQPWRPEPCDYCLVQTIPAGAYIDTDQLDDLVRFDKINYMTNERVNIEAIASKSDEFDLYLFGDTGSLYTIDLPIHFRYQLPGKQRFVKVSLEPPKMYINCTLEPTEHFSTDAKKLTEIRCRDGDDICLWQQVNYEMHSDPIAVSIPIGSEILEPVVSAVTICCSWIACFFVVRALYRKFKELETRL